jgi:hypothetical protein
LQAYLKGGGSLLLALEPKRTGGLEKILAGAGLVPMNNYVLNVVDTAMGKGVQQGQTLATVFSNTSEITKVFGKNEAVLFRNPMSFKRTVIPEGVAVDEIVKVPESSMSFENLDLKAEGPLGAYSLVVAAHGKYMEATGKDFNLIVAGDADFLGNQLLYQNLNRDLVLNSIASLAGEKDLISIVAKEAQTTKLNMTDTAFYLFIFCFAIPVPLLLLGSSVTLWMRRRHA